MDGMGNKGKYWIWGWNCVTGTRLVLRGGKNHSGTGTITCIGGCIVHDTADIEKSGTKNSAPLCTVPVFRLHTLFTMVRKERNKWKAGFTVEAALLSPFICLVICGMLIMTLRLYQNVTVLSEEVKQRQEKGLSSTDLIRLEAVVEEML